MPPEAVAANVTVCPDLGLVGVIAKLAVKTPGAETVTDCVDVALLPRVSVTVRLTVNVPELVKA